MSVLGALFTAQIKLAVTIVTTPRYLGIFVAVCVVAFVWDYVRFGGFKGMYVAYVLPAVTALLVVVLTVCGVVGVSRMGMNRGVLVRIES